MQVFNTSRFSWSETNRTLVTEASDIQFNPARDMHQIYVDACDVGIALESHKTGAVATFYFDRADVDGENDISAWVFLPTTETVRKLPHLAETSVIIFND
jgi:hypothetical protein